MPRGSVVAAAAAARIVTAAGYVVVARCWVGVSVPRTLAQGARARGGRLSTRIRIEFFHDCLERVVHRAELRLCFGLMSHHGGHKL